MTRFEVCVFPVDLDQSAATVGRLDRTLTPSERDAPIPIRVARAATRIVLGNALGTDPARVAISRVCAHCGHPTHGRPTLAGVTNLSFSLSHSGSFAVVALAEGEAQLGVDVEEVKSRVRIDGLAARVLGADDLAAWRALSDSGDRLRSFLEAWTAKEAYLKALGTGITTRLRDVPTVVDGWTIRPLEVGDGRVGALAADRSGVAIRYSVLAPLATWSDGTAR